ncbi:Putative permease, DMT superfamily [Rheinheimera sp. A13L]|uniref:DMT family transporter n=1 Tax=Rheinheimera sp. A13L TaxID=506534 RepID=UPI0002124ACC|nr:EamA family transporter [Rheinheimera sp. A13L]EGM76372.1 Putative permease, DMT superfamily [Rheinheimera sp. A13L]
MNLPSYRYFYMAALAAAMMGTIGVIARYSEIDPASLTFYRLGVGTVILALYLTLTGQLRLLAGKPTVLVVFNGVLLASFILCFLSAIQTISLTLAILLVYLAPALSAIIAHFLFAERLTSRTLLLIILAFFGFFMLQEFQLGNPVEQQQGLWYALASLVTYTAFILLNKKVPATVPLYHKSFYQLLVGSLCVLPLVADQPWPEADQWVWLVIAGLFPGFLALVFALQAIQHLPTRVFGTLAYLEPVVVIIAAWLLFAEPMSVLQWLGALLILASGVAQAWLSQSPQQS